MFSVASAILDLAPFIIDALNITLKLKVKYSIDSPTGKWTSRLGNVIAMDYKNITPIIESAFKKNLINILDEASSEEESAT